MEKSTVKVSVIIPVYNTELYLCEAVESICSQTLQEIEIIIINDGSTDHSLTVAEELAKKDGRIKIYSQENQGLSITRNHGISHATGEYVYLMDSDDHLEKEALEACYKLCKEEELNFAFFDADVLNKDQFPNIPHQYNRSTCISNNYIGTGIELLKKQIDNYCYTPSVCLIFINSNYLKKIGITFYGGIIHEDQLFTAQLYLCAQRVGYISRKFFKRRYRADSIMTKKYSWTNLNGYFTVSKELLKFRYTLHSKEVNLIINSLLTQMLNAAIWNAHTMPFKERIRLTIICGKYPFSRYISLSTVLKMLFKSFINKTPSDQRY